MRRPVDPFELAAELIDPSKPDVFGILGYEPTCMVRVEASRALGYRSIYEALASAVALPPACGECPQEQFHAATEFDVLYGGAAGGGKTKALLMDDLRDAMYYPGMRIGAFRRTYDELSESLLKELVDVNYAENLGAIWNGTARELRFPNGSVIRYRYAETVEDASRRQGGEYQKLTIDERNLVPPEVVSILSERLRSGRRDLPVIGIRSGTNPGGPGHAENKERFIDSTDYGRNVVVDLRGRTVRFIPSKVTDNPHVNEEYVHDLDAIPDPARRRAMRDGDWGTFAGQMFTEWGNGQRHRVAPFHVPPQWDRYVGIDYGYAKPWATVWGAVDPDGRLWIYREFYEAGVGESEQARRIIRAEELPIPPEAPEDADQADYMEPIVQRAADPAMWAKLGENNSIAETYIQTGCYIVKANNDRLSGWQRFHSYLSDGPACSLHRAQGLETCPMMHIFETCEELIKAIPGAPRDEKKLEDINTHYPHDHDLDATRYLMMAIGDGPSFYFADETPKYSGQQAQEFKLFEEEGHHQGLRLGHTPFVNPWNNDVVAPWAS